MSGVRGVRAEEGRYEGEPAVVLTAGSLSAVFLPDLGLTGVSLRYRGAEHLAVPGGVATLRSGHTAGLPLLAPWANRLSGRRYRADGVDVDLAGLPLTTDGRGLPIHGLLVGRPGWSVDALAADGDAARLRASLALDSPAFPFPHRLEVTATARDARLTVDTTVVPTGERPVPLAFGWHPYLQLPDASRDRWWLLLPDRTHWLLDDRGIPTGAEAHVPGEAAPVGGRTLDDLYRLRSGRKLAFADEGGDSVELDCVAGYPFTQVWLPEDRPFGALEPMTAPTNALVDGTTPTVAPGDSFTATFALTMGLATPAG